MKLLIQTQVYENYGAHEWDGKGQCPQYWKAKGGSDYVVKKFKGNYGDATLAIMALRDQVEQNNDFFRENIIIWLLVKDDHLTEYEKSQLEYEGKITFPTQELEYA